MKKGVKCNHINAQKVWSKLLAVLIAKVCPWRMLFVINFYDLPLICVGIINDLSC